MKLHFTDWCWSFWSGTFLTVFFTIVVPNAVLINPIDVGDKWKWKKNHFETKAFWFNESSHAFHVLVACTYLWNVSAFSDFVFVLSVLMCCVFCCYLFIFDRFSTVKWICFVDHLFLKNMIPNFFFNCYHLLFERFLNAILDFQKQNYVCCTMSQNNNMYTYIRSIDGEWIKHFKHLDNWQKIINNVSMNIGQCNQIATYWPSPKQLSIKFLILQ